MSAIGGLFGLGGGASGTGYAAPNGTSITPGTNAGQLQGAYGGNQSALAQQQGLLNALQQQQGINNQSQVYNQLQGVVNGTGPNPAQAQLAQATGANTANQAALMAGQRGAGANTGLIARQAAQQGAANQQNAVGQAATLQAQQSLGALGQAGSLANQQAAQQIGATTANTQAQQSEQNILQGANTAANNANVSMQGNINSANAALAGTQMQGQQGVVGGVLGGIGTGFGLFAEGGRVSYANGGYTLGPIGNDGLDTPNPSGPGMYSGTPYSLGVNTDLSGPQSDAGKFIKGWAGENANPFSAGPTIQAVQGSAGSNALQRGMQEFTQGAIGLGKKYLSSGGKVPAMVSPGEKYLSPKDAKAVAEGKKSALKSGKTIPGKAKEEGNSYKNDTVPAMLKPGGVVVDRETLHSKDPERAAADFVAAALAKAKSRKS